VKITGVETHVILPPFQEWNGRELIRNQLYEIRYRTVFVVRAGGGFVEAVKPFRAKKIDTICVDCSRAASGYFESIVQVRSGDASRAKKLAEKIRRALCKSTFVAKTEESRHGIDLYVGSNKATMLVLDRLGLAPEKSAKLHGLKDGQRIYRTTYCVRC
jgi:NMD protein affecting ribosome stability and mRNA decay